MFPSELGLQLQPHTSSSYDRTHLLGVSGESYGATDAKGAGWPYCWCIGLHLSLGSHLETLPEAAGSAWLTLGVSDLMGHVLFVFLLNPS